MVVAIHWVKNCAKCVEIYMETFKGHVINQQINNNLMYKKILDYLFLPKGDRHYIIFYEIL